MGGLESQLESEFRVGDPGRGPTGIGARVVLAESESWDCVEGAWF